MKEFQITSCFTKDAKKTNKSITALELACLLLKTTGQADVAPFAAFRKLMNQGVYPRDMDKEKTLNEIELMEFAMRAYGLTIPVFVSENQWPYTDLEPNPVVQKAIEIGVFSSATDTKIGIRTNKKINRSEAIAFLYKLSLIEAANHSIFDRPDQNFQLNVLPSNPQLNVLQATIDNIRQKSLFKNQFDETDALQKAIKALVSSLDDPYSEYYTPEENERFFQNLGGSEFEGIGAYLEEVDKDNDGVKEIIVVSPIKGGPAEKAGILAGDVITHVNGTDISTFNLQEAIAIIKGPSGTTVKLTVKRNGRTLDFEVPRQKITVPALSNYKQDGYHIIHIYQFGLNAAKEIKPILEQAQRENAPGIIIDLRNNPGGFLHVVVEMLDYFIEEGQTLVQIKTLDETGETPAYTTPIVTNIPIVIITNRGSASASEILAGTLRDYGLATIIGEKSYGKGSVQEVIGFNDGSALKITTALWLTGKGNTIDHIGIVPDVDVEDDLSTPEDEVLEKAFDILSTSGGSRERRFR